MITTDTQHAEALDPTNRIRNYIMPVSAVIRVWCPPTLGGSIDNEAIVVRQDTINVSRMTRDKDDHAPPNISYIAHGFTVNFIEVRDNEFRKLILMTLSIELNIEARHGLVPPLYRGLKSVDCSDNIQMLWRDCETWKVDSHCKSSDQAIGRVCWSILPEEPHEKAGASKLISQGPDFGNEPYKCSDDSDVRFLQPTSMGSNHRVIRGRCRNQAASRRCHATDGSPRLPPDCTSRAKHPTLADSLQHAHCRPLQLTETHSVMDFSQSLTDELGWHERRGAKSSACLRWHCKARGSVNWTRSVCSAWNATFHIPGAPACF